MDKDKWPPFMRGPFPPVNFAGRVVNELIHRKNTGAGCLVSVDWCVRLLGVPALLFIFWMWKCIESEKMGILSTNVIDLYKLWALVRWAPEDQWLCFDLSDVTPHLIEHCGGRYYDMIEVWQANGIDTSEAL